MITAKEARNISEKEKNKELIALKNHLKEEQKKIEEAIKEAAKNNRFSLNIDIKYSPCLAGDEIVKIYKEFFEPFGYKVFLFFFNEPNETCIKLCW